MTPKSKSEKSLDEQLIHLVSHAVRVQALVVLTQRVASPKEIAAELKVPLSTASHHVKELAKMGLVELVDEKKRRGAVEHFYRAVLRPIWSTEDWAALSLEERQRFSVWTTQLILGDVARSLSTGAFDARPDRHVSRTLLAVDEEGWKEILKILGDALDEILQVQATSAERCVQGDECPTIDISTSMFCIETSSPKSDRQTSLERSSDVDH